MSNAQETAIKMLRNKNLQEDEMTEKEEVTRKLSRRQFVKGAAAGAVGVAAVGALGGCGEAATAVPPATCEPCPTCPPEKECEACPEPEPCPTCEPCPPCEEAKAPWLPETWDEEADVVIVGFGGAGATAAIAGADAGGDMLLIEVAPEEFRGGNTTCTGGGWIHCYDKEKYTTYMKKLCRGATPEKFIEDWVEAATQTLDWVEKLGFPYKLRTHDYGHYFVTAESVGWGVSENSGIDQYQTMDADGNYTNTGVLFQMLAAEVEKRDVRTLYETRATGLVQDPMTKEVFGVKATDKTGEEKYFKAKKGVILACGGYENSPYFIDSHILPGVRVHPAGTPYNVGDGVHMAQQAGADIFHMAGCEWMGYGINPPGHDVAINVEVRRLGSGIVVNRFGKRIFNEDKKLAHTRTFPALEFDGYPDDPTALSDYKGCPSFLVFDEAKRLAGPIAKSKLEAVTDMAPPVMGFLAVKGLYEWSADNMQEVENGMIKKADTIQELAEVSGIDPATLEESIKNWNDYCKAGQDLEFGRAPDFMSPIEVPPYYAMEMGPIFINTQGGPKHSNLDGKVLDRNDNPIPRLYAAGECGSVYSLMYHGSGNIAEALIVGKLAVETALEEEPWA